MKQNLCIWMLFCYVSSAPALIGQIATTSIRGWVADTSGAPISNAKVTLIDISNGQGFNTATDSAGQYFFLQIPPARYKVETKAAGFGGQNKTAELVVDRIATIDFTLTVQPHSDTVEVSAVAQTLNFTDASLGGSKSAGEIQALPSETRNVADLLTLQSGIIYLPPTLTDGRSGTVNGGRSDQGNITVDGVDDNDQVNGYAFTGVLRETQDSIEEFRVITAGSNADSGHSSGAQISILTKSGTNAFHGSAYEYYRPTFTVANDWFNKQAEHNSSLPNVPGKLLRNIFGADLGGPFIKDRLFFFGNYEGSRLAEDAQENRTVPTATYRAGELSYPDAKRQTIVLDSAQFASLDVGCQICGSSGYPFPAGANPNALAYFNSMPAANGSLSGDGYNAGSYSFSSPAPISLNTTIGRFEFVASQHHRIFVRANLQKDTTDYPEQFPGQPPSHAVEDNSKGMTAGDTWTITSHVVNDVRFGYVRQGFSDRGIGKGDYVDFVLLSFPTAETRTIITSVPLVNLVDHLSWSKSKHTLQLGENWRLIHQNHATDANSFNEANTSAFLLADSPPQPTAIGEPAINDGFGNSYQIAFANLTGTLPLLTNAYNYLITSSQGGTLLEDGAFLNRHFKANELEWYVQDVWHLVPHVTMTFGLRHTILQTPYETSGQEVAPTIDTHAWSLRREAAARAGQIYEPDLYFMPAGPFYKRPGFWPKSKGNLAPRFAIAYSPAGKTTLRFGGGIYFEHYGESLVENFDQHGAYGVSSQVTTPGSAYSIEGSADHPPAPRFTGRHNLPTISSGPRPTTQTFPYAAPLGAFGISWGLDNQIKTPYSESFDASLQRELPEGFILEASYAGRLGRHLLQQVDLAEPVDYVDPSGGGDYYAAGTQLAKLADLNRNDPMASVPTIQYFEDVFPFMAGLDFAGESATQAIYRNEWAPNRMQYGETLALADIDLYCVYGCPGGYQSKFWHDQFSSLYALSSIGTSSYHSGQVTLRHPSSHGLSLDFMYTLSKSIDLGSDTERSTENGTFSTNTYALSEIINTWSPKLNRGTSDFDTRHLITVDWIYQLPFSRGKKRANKLIADALLTGWQWAGINRWSSGLPFSLVEPGWTTDWQIPSFAVATIPIKTHRHFDTKGNPQFFADPDSINSGVVSGDPVRLPYPGEAGQRNNFRGDGLFNIDSGLAKSWKLHEVSSVRFSWEVYNVTNTVRFDPPSIDAGLTSGTLGIAGKLLGQPRRMQLSLRYDF